jgi:hypothetical protein
MQEHTVRMLRQWERQPMISWSNAKRIGVYLFFGGLALWFISELLISDKALGQVLFLIGWMTAIVGALLNGVAVVKERFFSD